MVADSAGVGVVDGDGFAVGVALGVTVGDARAGASGPGHSFRILRIRTSAEGLRADRDLGKPRWVRRVDRAFLEHSDGNDLLNRKGIFVNRPGLGYN